MITATLLVSGVLYVFSPITTEAGKDGEKVEIIPNEMSTKVPEGPYVLINLNTNQLFLRNGTNTLGKITLVSQGKPSSYYETIGGSFKSDYKEPIHFSSIGHVYMPYSIHIFGNYFIHGIPYYPDGTKVSSAYSGGCIRLEDIDAKRVYNFLTKGTPIIITRGNEYDFNPTRASTKIISSLHMTELMVASISLEFLTQDNEILDASGDPTTRRLLLPFLLKSKDSNIGMLYAHSMGDDEYISNMNKKALSLGLTNTTFTGINTPAITTEEDYARFMGYIITYKSYLQNILESTTTITATSSL